MDNNVKPERVKPQKKPVKKSDMSRIWITLAYSLFVFILIAVAGSIYLLYQRSLQRMEVVDRELVDLRSAMNTDSVRQHKIQKIMAIAQKHNSKLSSMDLYDIASVIYEMDVRYSNLDVDLICAVITHESANTWRPDIVSPAGAMGLMQIMPVTGLFLAEYEEITWTDPEGVLLNPTYNIRMGCRFLSVLIGQYGLDGALAAYNAGERHASIWLASGKDDTLLWKETRNYIPTILGLYDNYQSQSL